MRRGVWLLLVLGRAAWADDTHYQDYLLGGRAVGLGGAYVALGDDPSGIYFNPAGIVDSTRPSVQVSSTLYGLEMNDSFFAAFGQVANLKKIFTELTIVPASAAFISTLGSAGPDGLYQQAYGFGAFVPSFRTLHVENVSVVPEGELSGRCDRLAYRRDQTDRTVQFGAAYSARLDETWSLGVSGFLHYRSLRDVEETSCFRASAPEGQAAFRTAQTNLDMAVAGLLVSVGLKAYLGEGWLIGGTVTTPSIRAFDSASLRVTRGSADPESGRSDFLLRELRELRANTKVGTAFRVGAAHIIPKHSTFSADLTLYAPTSYRLFEVPPEEFAVRDAVTLVSDVERRFIANLNVGAEYLLTRSFSISGGLFTNFASSPPIEGPAGERVTEPALPHVHAAGGSVVLGVFGNHTLTRAGLTMSYGTGTDVVPRFAGVGALGEATEYTRVELNQLFLFFFLSSTFRY